MLYQSENSNTIHVLVGTGGVGAPVSLKLAVASVDSLILAGILTVVSWTLSRIALDARTAWEADSLTLRRTAEATAADMLERTARRYGYGECEKAAISMRRNLIRRGLNGEVITLTWQPASYGNVWSTIANRSAGDNNLHVWVLSQGRVHCNIHPAGLLEQQWINDFTVPNPLSRRIVNRVPF